MDCKLRAKNCGGCPMLATEYAAQLKKKEADVRALLGKYGPVAPIRGMETPYHYRNKVISTFAPAAGGKLTSGIYAARTHKVLPVESCLLQDEVLDKVMLAVRAAANACRYQPFNEDKGTGLLRHCLLRRGVATGQVMVVLVTAQPVLPGAKNFVKALLAEAEKRGVPVTTVVQNYNPRRTSVVLGEDEKVLYGKGFILDTLTIRRQKQSTENLRLLRHEIDRLDNDLLEVLARRMRVCRDIGMYKKEHSMPVLQTGRFDDIMHSRVATAVEMGMSADFMRTVLAAIHEESVRQQIEILNRR